MLCIKEKCRLSGRSLKKPKSLVDSGPDDTMLCKRVVTKELQQPNILVIPFKDWFEYHWVLLD